MNLVNVIHRIFFIIITIQSSVTQWFDPVAAADPLVRDNIIDVGERLAETELLIQAEQAIIDEKHRQWKSCLESTRPRVECNALYESMLREEKPLTRLKHYHAMLEEAPHAHKHCRAKRSEQECILDKHDRESRITIMERELYPWKDIHELCIAILSKNQCYDILDEIQIPRYRNLVPESLITIAKAHICLDAGRSEEDCELEAMEHYEQVVAPRDEL